jgi:peptide-methionine (S)-S-oxide reductase
VLSVMRTSVAALAFMVVGHQPVRHEQQTAVFAGGCFWGIEAVFEHVKGVTDVVSGYSGGSVKNPSYEAVTSGETGHAEAVKVRFDPAIVSYETLLTVFFSVAHDPTELNRQGPDVGTQYRSAIFYANEQQAGAARSTIERLTREKAYRLPIVTQVVPLSVFYDAERYHQDYLKNHPTQLYIMMYDQPKLRHLKKQFPALYQDR